MAIINFRHPEAANEFAEAYAGKLFNSMEVGSVLCSTVGNDTLYQPESCHIVRILSVTIETEDTVSTSMARGPSQLSTYELPTCPVCLERMDAAVTGLITVPCSHTFHCMCLSKWGDSRLVLVLYFLRWISPPITLFVFQVPCL